MDAEAFITAASSVAMILMGACLIGPELRRERPCQLRVTTGLALALLALALTVTA